MDRVITEEIRTKLVEVGELQTAFWESLTELEAMTGLEIDGTEDLEGMTVEALFEADAEDEEVNLGI